jgi:hypothetical protein
MSDLDLAVSIIDDARHAITGARKRIATTEAVLFGSDAARLVRERDDRRRIAAAGQLPPHVIHHQRSTGEAS